jgi:glycosyltransferase involved in cell wall biosynthesis
MRPTDSPYMGQGVFVSKGNKPRIAFVIPRFDPDLAGGAEVLAKGLASMLVRQGYLVSVFTTCARDHFTWDNYYPPGDLESNGISISRFPVNENRDISRFLAIQEKIVKYQDLPFEEEKEWISQSVVSEPLFKHLERQRNEFDCFIFIPYLFGTTYWGAQIVDDKAVLIPCLHDEPYAHLRIFKELFDNVKAVMFNTGAEERLGEELYDLPARKSCVVGLGIEPSGTHDPARFRKKFRLPGPFLLYAGRREGSKNSDLLIEYFRVFQRYNKINVKLAMMGTGELPLQPIDKQYVVDLGYLSEEDKRDAFAAAAVFCQPSLNESLSIVLMEAWLAETAALVHARCPVTVEHCIKSNGGLFFDDYREFEEILALLLTNPGLAAKLGKNGSQYVRSEYNWEAVLRRFEEGLAKFGFV